MIIVLLGLELFPIEHNSSNKDPLQCGKTVLRYPWAAEIYENEISVEMQEIFDISKLNERIAKCSLDVNRR